MLLDPAVLCKQKCMRPTCKRSSTDPQNLWAHVNSSQRSYNSTLASCSSFRQEKLVRKDEGLLGNLSVGRERSRAFKGSHAQWILTFLFSVHVVYSRREHVARCGVASWQTCFVDIQPVSNQEAQKPDVAQWLLPNHPRPERHNFLSIPNKVDSKQLFAILICTLLKVWWHVGNIGGWIMLQASWEGKKIAHQIPTLVREAIQVS